MWADVQEYEALRRTMLGTVTGYFCSGGASGNDKCTYYGNPPLHGVDQVGCGKKKQKIGGGVLRVAD